MERGKFYYYKKYMTACAMIIFVMTSISGCESDVTVEFSEIVENVDYDTDIAQESNVTDDSETVNSTEIYGRFLEGEAAVEWMGQQVQINELFWDNDIEYCFLDIDGDGGEELQIRDSVIYYVVKVQDQIPVIIFEGRWGYEPIVTNKLCGLVNDWYKYGGEDIKFIRINVDGSKESEEAYWYDDNKNCKMDEEDSFRIHGNSANMEQYVQYRQDHVSDQASDKIKWTDKQLKHFETWKEAYIDFLHKMYVIESADDNWEYSLIYVDDDDIPELFIDTGFSVSGETVVSFYDGTIGTMNRCRSGMGYIEYGSLLYNENGATGFYPCNIYRLEKGVFSEIGTGWCNDHCDAQGNIYYEYFWEDNVVTEAEFEAHIDELIDRSKCVVPSVLYTEDEILEMLTS